MIAMDPELAAALEEVQGVVEAALQRHLVPEGRDDLPASLVDAVRYAVFPGGKRLRPVLSLLACRAAGGRDEDALGLALGLELVHCYSLVHDDLPAMDDDDLRRGRPTCHKAFGEATAILAGDALLTRAFELVAALSPPQHAATLVVELARASGVAGMVAGQAADLEAEGGPADARVVEWIHRHKTAELIRCAVRGGACAAGCGSESLRAADEYGLALGHAFQVVDDLLGRHGSQELTGKPVGRDDERGKQTYPAAVGEHRARAQVESWTERAVVSAGAFARPELLRALAHHLRGRLA